MDWDLPFALDGWNSWASLAALTASNVNGRLASSQRLVLVHMIGDTFCLEQALLVMGPSPTPARIPAVERSKTYEKGPV